MSERPYLLGVTEEPTVGKEKEVKDIKGATT